MSANVTLDCGDSPLTVASSVASFWTTAVALGVTYYAFYRTFVTASEVYGAFCLDISLFQLQLTHIQSDLGTWKSDGGEPEELGLRVIREAVYEGNRTYTKAAALVRKLDSTMGEAVKHKLLSVTRIRAGYLWWRSGKGQAQEITASVQRHRSHLLFYERHLLRRHIHNVHGEVQDLRRELSALLQSPLLAQTISNTGSATGPASGPPAGSPPKVASN